MQPCDHAMLHPYRPWLRARRGWCENKIENPNFFFGSDFFLECFAVILRVHEVRVVWFFFKVYCLICYVLLITNTILLAR